MIGTQETLEALSQFCFGGKVKKYKSCEELLDYIVLKGVIVTNRQDAIDKFQRYTYYSIINTYKEVFKKDNKYIMQQSDGQCDYYLTFFGSKLELREYDTGSLIGTFVCEDAE